MASKLRQHWVMIVAILLSAIVSYGGAAISLGTWRGVIETRVDTVEQAQVVIKTETNRKLERLEDLMLEIKGDIGELKGAIQ